MQVSTAQIWQKIYQEAEFFTQKERLLVSFLHEKILNHQSISDALSAHLATTLAQVNMPFSLLREIIHQAFISDPIIIEAAHYDLQAIVARDPAVNNWMTPFLYFKGFHALQTYRVAHWLWHQDRKLLATHLQHQSAIVFGVDVHPAARIGHGILFDHATGIVIGETAIVENDVSLLQEVTLGGTGKAQGLRHPKICEGVMIGAGAKILGHIQVGKGAKVGAGSIVLKDVPAHTTVAGIPARIVGQPNSAKPALDMNQSL